MQPKFIAFCGIDGSGKSTQSRLLYNKLLDNHIPVDLSKEPTDGPIGTLIRKVLSGEEKISNISLETLFKLDRFEHEIKIRLLNSRGIVCISDRSIISGIAYDTHKEKSLEELYQEHENVKFPSELYFIDVPVEVALERITARCEEDGTEPDIYETPDQLESIRNRFLRILEYYSKEKLIKVHIIDGTKTEEVISNEIFELSQQILDSIFLES